MATWRGRIAPGLALLWLLTVCSAVVSQAEVVKNNQVINGKLNKINVVPNLEDGPNAYIPALQVDGGMNQPLERHVIVKRRIKHKTRRKKSIVRPKFVKKKKNQQKKIVPIEEYLRFNAVDPPEPKPMEAVASAGEDSDYNPKRSPGRKATDFLPSEEKSSYWPEFSQEKHVIVKRSERNSKSKARSSSIDTSELLSSSSGSSSDGSDIDVETDSESDSAYSETHSKSHSKSGSLSGSKSDSEISYTMSSSGEDAFPTSLSEQSNKKSKKKSSSESSDDTSDKHSEDSSKGDSKSSTKSKEKSKNKSKEHSKLLNDPKVKTKVKKKGKNREINIEVELDKKKNTNTKASVKLTKDLKIVKTEISNNEPDKKMKLSGSLKLKNAKEGIPSIPPNGLFVPDSVHTFMTQAVKEVKQEPAQVNKGRGSKTMKVNGSSQEKLKMEMMKVKPADPNKKEEEHEQEPLKDYPVDGTVEIINWQGTFAPIVGEPYVAPVHHQPDSFWDAIYTSQSPDLPTPPGTVDSAENPGTEASNPTSNPALKAETNRFRQMADTLAFSMDDNGNIDIQCKNKDKAKKGDKKKPKLTPKEKKAKKREKKKEKASKFAADGQTFDLILSNDKLNKKAASKMELEEPNRFEEPFENGFHMPPGALESIVHNEDVHKASFPAHQGPESLNDPINPHHLQETYKIHAISKSEEDLKTPSEEERESGTTYKPEGAYEFPSFRHPDFNPDTAYDENGIPIHESPGWTPPPTLPGDNRFGKGRSHAASAKNSQVQGQVLKPQAAHFHAETLLPVNSAGLAQNSYLHPEHHSNHAAIAVHTQDLHQDQHHVNRPGSVNAQGYRMLTVATVAPKAAYKSLKKLHPENQRIPQHTQDLHDHLAAQEIPQHTQDLHDHLAAQELQQFGQAFQEANLEHAVSSENHGLLPVLRGRVGGGTGINHNIHKRKVDSTELEDVVSSAMTTQELNTAAERYREQQSADKFKAYKLTDSELLEKVDNAPLEALNPALYMHRNMLKIEKKQPKVLRKLPQSGEEEVIALVFSAKNGREMAKMKEAIFNLKKGDALDGDSEKIVAHGKQGEALNPLLYKQRNMFKVSDIKDDGLRISKDDVLKMALQRAGFDKNGVRAMPLEEYVKGPHHTLRGRGRENYNPCFLNANGLLKVRTNKLKPSSQEHFVSKREVKESTNPALYSFKNLFGSQPKQVLPLSHIESRETPANEKVKKYVGRNREAMNPFLVNFPNMFGVNYGGGPSANIRSQFLQEIPAPRSGSQRTKRLKRDLGLIEGTVTPKTSRHKTADDGDDDSFVSYFEGADPNVKEEDESTPEPEHTTDKNVTQKYPSHYGPNRKQKKLARRRQKILQTNAATLHRLSKMVLPQWRKELEAHNLNPDSIKLNFTDSVEEEIKHIIEQQLLKGAPGERTVDELTQCLYEMMENRKKYNKSIGHIYVPTPTRGPLLRGTIHIKPEEGRGQYHLQFWPSDEAGESARVLNGSLDLKQIKINLAHRNVASKLLRNILTVRPRELSHARANELLKDIFTKPPISSTDPGKIKLSTRKADIFHVFVTTEKVKSLDSNIKQKKENRINISEASLNLFNVKKPITDLSQEPTKEFKEVNFKDLYTIKPGLKKEIVEPVAVETNTVIAVDSTKIVNKETMKPTLTEKPPTLDDKKPFDISENMIQEMQSEDLRTLEPIKQVLEKDIIEPVLVKNKTVVKTAVEEIISKKPTIASDDTTLPTTNQFAVMDEIQKLRDTITKSKNISSILLGELEARAREISSSTEVPVPDKMALVYDGWKLQQRIKDFRPARSHLTMPPYVRRWPTFRKHPRVDPPLPLGLGTTTTVTTSKSSSPSPLLTMRPKYGGPRHQPFFFDDFQRIKTVYPSKTTFNKTKTLQEEVTVDKFHTTFMPKIEASISMSANELPRKTTTKPPFLWSHFDSEEHQSETEYPDFMALKVSDKVYTVMPVHRRITSYPTPSTTYRLTRRPFHHAIKHHVKTGIEKILSIFGFGKSKKKKE